MPYPTRVARPRRVPTSPVEDALGGSANLSPAPFSLSRGRLEAAPLHPADHMLVEAAQWDSDAACALVRDVLTAPAHYGNHKRHRAACNARLCPVEDHLAAPQAAQCASTEPESIALGEEQEGSSHGH